MKIQTSVELFRSVLQGRHLLELFPGFLWALVCLWLQLVAQFVPLSWASVLTPQRNFWHICSGRKTLLCGTGWHLLPGCLNSDKISHRMRAAVGPRLGVWFQSLRLQCWASCKHTCTCSAVQQPGFHCFFVPFLIRLSGFTWEDPEQNLFPSFPPAWLCYNTWPPSPSVWAVKKKRVLCKFPSCPNNYTQAHL